MEGYAHSGGEKEGYHTTEDIFMSLDLWFALSLAWNPTVPPYESLNLTEWVKILFNYSFPIKINPIIVPIIINHSMTLAYIEML